MIRLAKLSEIEEIIKITTACAAKMISENIYQWNEHYPNPEAFLKDVERDELYVLIADENVIGCITITSEKEPDCSGARPHPSPFRLRLPRLTRFRHQAPQLPPHSVGSAPACPARFRHPSTVFHS